MKASECLEYRCPHADRPLGDGMGWTIDIFIIMPADRASIYRIHLSFGECCECETDSRVSWPYGLHVKLLEGLQSHLYISL